MSRSHHTTPSAYSGNKDYVISILLVEDIPGDQILITRYLNNIKQQDYHIHKAPTLKASLEILSKEHIDLVLLDLKLPDSSGLNTFDSIHKAYPHHPIIIMTGEQVEEKIAMIALEKGAQDYLEKDDLSSAILRKAIQYALKRKEMVRGLENAQRLGKLGFWEVDPINMTWKGASFVDEMLGRSDDPIKNLADFLNMVHPRDQKMVQEKFREAAINKQPFEIIHKVLLPSEEVKIFSLNGNVVLDPNGNVRLLEGTAQDISETQKLREAEHQKELAQKKARLRQDFLAKTSHEIRTPLNPILLLTDLLLEGRLTNEQRKHIGTIKYAARTLLALVNDILDLSKIEAGKIAFGQEPFSIPNLLEQIRDLLKNHAENKAINLRFSLEYPLPELVIGDAIRLSQILINLNTNAIKFTQEGEVCTTISTVKQTENRIWLRFEVSDTGIGIPENQLETIFNSFEQVKKPGQYSEGTGLGLTIVRQLVNLQGGSLSVKSKLGEGSTFCFEMPFDLPGSDTPYSSTQALASQTDADDRDLNGLKILLVEDDPLNQLVTEKLLERWNAEVKIANHGREGLELLTQEAFDVVLMDIQMPIMDGLETSKTIRNTLEPPLSEIPIIALTANAITGSDDECFKVGMNDYVSKPIETDIFYRKLVSYVKRISLSSEPQITQEPESEDSKNEHTKFAMAETRFTDLSALTSMYGGDMFLVKKTVSKIVDKVPEYLNDLNNFREEKNFKKVAEVIHKLKANVVGYMGISEFSEHGLDFMIQNIKRNEASVEEIDDFLEKFNSVVNQGIEELKEDLKDFE